MKLWKRKKYPSRDFKFWNTGSEGVKILLLLSNNNIIVFLEMQKTHLKLLKFAKNIMKQLGIKEIYKYQ